MTHNAPIAGRKINKPIDPTMGFCYIRGLIKVEQKMELTAEIVRELLDCDIKTGRLFWKDRDIKWFDNERVWKLWNTQNSGREAFVRKSKGYASGVIFDKKYLSHRIIWLWVYGEWPNGQIDHLDGNKSNNAISNLADKTHAENHKNKGRHKNNKSGFKGVSFDRNSNKWVAQIFINGEKIYLGLYNEPEEAFSAYVKAAREAEFTERHIFG